MSSGKHSVDSPDHVPNLGTKEPEVILESVNQKGVITLNRPKALNALNLSMAREIYPVLKEWESSQKFVVIKATGDF